MPIFSSLGEFFLVPPYSIHWSFCSFSARTSRSNSSCWHGTPMSSEGVRNVYTHPIARSNLKVDVGKNAFSGGQLNSILPFVVFIGSLFLIRTPTRVLQKSGTYQSKPIALCLLTNSSITMLSVLCRSTVGFMAGSNVTCPVVGFELWTLSWLLPKSL